MELQSNYIWKIIITTSIAIAMSSIIPVDLLSYAVNPAYLSTLTTTNTSNPTTISLLAYDPSFPSVIGSNATARQLHSLDYEAFHEAGVYNQQLGGRPQQPNQRHRHRPRRQLLPQHRALPRPRRSKRRNELLPPRHAGKQLPPHPRPLRRPGRLLNPLFPRLRRPRHRRLGKNPHFLPRPQLLLPQRRAPAPRNRRPVVHRRRLRLLPALPARG
jgi:hypothetical protein